MAADVIEFFIPFKVLPKGNSKKIVKCGRFTKLVEPARNAANADTLKLLCVQHRPLTPILGPVTVVYRFQFVWRKADAQRRAKGKLPDWMPCDTGKDLGNLTKQMDDVLESAGFFANDSQIWCYGETEKVWADNPGVHVRIEPWEQK